jgi:hypothetical protein
MSYAEKGVSTILEVDGKSIDFSPQEKLLKNKQQG